MNYVMVIRVFTVNRLHYVRFIRRITLYTKCSECDKSPHLVYVDVGV
jgi:hypothetical protein